MRNPAMVKVGAVSALVYATIQVLGNAVHPPVPSDPAQALMLIAHSAVWPPAHVLLLSSYFVIIPLIVGVAATFEQDPTAVRVAVPLIVAAVPLGVAQIGTHLAIFRPLAVKFVAAGDAAQKADLIRIYSVIWPYNLALELAHLLVIFLAIVLVASAMLRASIYPRWVAWLGILGGCVAATGTLVGELVVRRTSGALGDVVFGLGNVPLLVWVVAVGVVLLRLPKAVPV